MLGNQIGARRCFSKMGARFQGNVQGCFFELFLVFYRVDGIHLGMWTSIRVGKPFSNYVVLMNDHTPHHWIWSRGSQSLFGQFYAAKEVFLMYLHPAKIEQ